MKCQNCGYEGEGNFKFCPGCGKEITNLSGIDPMYTQNAPSVRDKVLRMLKDDLFLILCILETTAVGVGVLNGNLSLLGVLFTIFLWMAWSKARGDQLDIDSMRRISGTIFAKHVINWVLFGATVLSGILITACAGTIARSTDKIKEMIDSIDMDFELNMIKDAFVTTFEGIELVPEVITAILVGIGILLIIVAIVIALVNIFGTGKLHKFAKTLYISADKDENSLVSLNGARVWLLIYGIYMGISAINNLTLIAEMPFAFISSACSAAVYIVAYMLVKKHFDS